MCVRERFPPAQVGGRALLPPRARASCAGAARIASARAPFCRSNDCCVFGVERSASRVWLYRLGGDARTTPDVVRRSRDVRVDGEEGRGVGCRVKNGA